MATSSSASPSSSSVSATVKSKSVLVESKELNPQLKRHILKVQDSDDDLALQPDEIDEDPEFTELLSAPIPEKIGVLIGIIDDSSRLLRKIKATINDRCEPSVTAQANGITQDDLAQMMISLDVLCRVIAPLSN